MTIEFGDAEPEDSWDASDTVEEQIHNLFRRIHLLDNLGEQPTPRRGDPLADLEDRLRAWKDKRSAHRERDDLRARQIEEDIAFIRNRLREQDR